MRTLARRLALLALVALPITGGGCATAIGTAYRCEPYSGTRLDATVLGNTSAVDRPNEVLLAGAALVDLPLSFAADTVLLPVTIPVALASD